MVVNELKSNS